jgi:DNA-binding NtrC family response regulator
MSPYLARKSAGREGASSAASDPLRVLLVDDDTLQARLLKAHVDRPGRLHAVVVGSAQEALEAFAAGGIDAVVSDVLMPGTDGIELVRRIRALDAHIPLILASNSATLERAVEGMRAGATDFVQKPVNATLLAALLQRAVEERPLRARLEAARPSPGEPETGRYLAGDHPSLDAVREFAAQVAQNPLGRALILGESGTGKSVLARAIHELSATPGSFVQINCAALPAQLLESELFGHEAGAFTDARTLKRGLAEVADRGTLFLDEIDALPLELQAKLLVFLETREVRRIGSLRAVPVRTRVITATGADLRRLARERAFRPDLLYRLDVASVEMPPLRSMPGVIPQLVRRFLHELAEEYGHVPPELDEGCLEALARYPWPGNARELRNAVDRALMSHRTGRLRVSAPAAEAGAGPLPGGLALEPGLTLEEVERRYLEATLRQGSGDFATLAARLGISRKTLWDKRRRYGL